MDGLPGSTEYWRGSWARIKEKQTPDIERPICKKLLCGTEGLRMHIKVKHKESS